MSKFNREEFINNMIDKLRLDLKSEAEKGDLRYIVNHHNSLVAVDDFVCTEDIKDVVQEEIDWCCDMQRQFCSTMSDEELEEVYG